jgi:hypothetical protein
MYILVNDRNIIVGSAMNLPSKESCSARGYRIYEIDGNEFSPTMIGTKLVDFEVVEHTKAQK